MTERNTTASQNSKVFRLYFDRISDTVFAAVTAVTFQQIKINTASFQIFADIKGKLVNAFGILVKKSWSFIKNDHDACVSFG